MAVLRLGLRPRLYIGFSILVAFGLGMSAYGMHGLAQVTPSITKLEAISNNLVRVEEVEREVETIRRAANRYLIDADQAALTDMKAAETRTASLLVEASSATPSEPQRQPFTRMSETLRTAVTQREAFVRSSNTAFVERTKLFTGGDALTEATGQLVEASKANPDAALTIAAAHLESAILLVRMANWRFLATQDPKGVATFAADQAKAKAALTDLERQADADMKPLISELSNALSIYAATFERTAASLTEGDAHANDDLRPSLRAMQQDANTALASMREEFAAMSAESVAAASETMWLQAAVAGVATVIGAVLAFAVARGIVGPIASMTAAMARLAQGDNDIQVPGRENTDEIGAMARAVEVFKQNAIENQRLNAAKITEQAARDRRQAAMENHTQDFGASFAGVMASLGQSADKMHTAANEMSEAAGSTRDSTSHAVDGANASARDLNSVAVATEQMAASVHEISRQVSHVTTAVTKAVDRAEETSKKVGGLSDTADRISDVVRLINDIAGQTNLLALNATIEAARAGEAGKGFAVVASEVKTLATQTARATDQIGAQIVAIRTSTEEAVDAVRDVSAAIAQVSEVATAIAAAVEQQAAATQEISASVQSVTRATTASAQAMEHVLTIAAQSDIAGRSVLTTAGEVGETANTLRVEVNDFLTAMKRGDDDRRAYVRMPGAGATASLSLKGSTAIHAVVRDVSRGGIALLCDSSAAPGTEAQIRFSGGTTVPGRVVRSDTGVLTVAFRQDATALVLLDRALEAFTPSNLAVAA